METAFLQHGCKQFSYKLFFCSLLLSIIGAIHLKAAQGQGLQFQEPSLTDAVQIGLIGGMGISSSILSEKFISLHKEFILKQMCKKHKT